MFYVCLFLQGTVFLFLVAGLPSPGHSSDLTVIGGIAERVSGSAITLAAGTYDIGQARLKNASGDALPASELARGRKVDLFVQKGKVTTVIIYPAVMVD